MLHLLPILLSINAVAFAAASPPHSARIDLLRRRPSPPVTQLEYLRLLLRSDQLRQQMIAARLRPPPSDAAGGHGYGNASHALAPAPPPESSESFAMPLTSGAYSGTGQYFVRFLLGTPAQRFTLVADTGSDLTWVKCRRGRRGRGQRPYGGGDRPFLPWRSGSYRQIQCSSEMCRDSLPFSLATCPSPASPCAYDYG